MKLYILGSGTCVPNVRRGSSGYAIKLPKSTILFDCGSGTTWKLGMVGVDYLTVDHIFITHFHPDHTADLIPFLFATKYPHPKGREKPLSIWGPKGFSEFYSSLKVLYDDWISPEGLSIEPDGVSVNDIDSDILKFDDFTLAAQKTFHTENSLAFKIESEGKSIVYSGDTDYGEYLIQLARDADILIIECSFPDSLKFKGHLTPSEVGKIANASQAKKIILTHLYPDCDEIDIVGQVKKHVDSEVILAEDLLAVEI